MLQFACLDIRPDRRAMPRTSNSTLNNRGGEGTPPGSRANHGPSSLFRPHGWATSKENHVRCPTSAPTTIRKRPCRDIRHLNVAFAQSIPIEPRPDKPGKSHPGFPLYPPMTRGRSGPRRSKAGRNYFGSWGDPQTALAALQRIAARPDGGTHPHQWDRAFHGFLRASQRVLGFAFGLASRFQTSTSASFFCGSPGVLRPRATYCLRSAVSRSTTSGCSAWRFRVSPTSASMS